MSSISLKKGETGRGSNLFIKACLKSLLFKSEQFLTCGVSECLGLPVCLLSFQERTGVQMIMIQDDPMPTGADKPLRITGDPHKVQVSHWGPVCAVYFFVLHSILHTEQPLKFGHRISAALFVNVCCGLPWGFFPPVFTASPWTCGQTNPRQGPGRVQSRQSRVWIQNGREQSWCKCLLNCDEDSVVGKINTRNK